LLTPSTIAAETDVKYSRKTNIFRHQG